MTVVEEVLKFEANAHRLGLPIKAILRRANVSVATFNRWKAGTMGPTLTNWRALERAYDVLRNKQLDEQDRAQV